MAYSLWVYLAKEVRRIAELRDSNDVVEERSFPIIIASPVTIFLFLLAVATPANHNFQHLLHFIFETSE